MPRTLPTVLKQEKNALASTNAWVVLLDITFKKTIENGMPVDTYDTANIQHIVNNTKEIVFNNITYTPYNFMINLPAGDSKGKLNNVTLTISNVAQVFQYFLEGSSGDPNITYTVGGVGAKVTMYVINTGHTGNLSDYIDLTLNYSVLSTTANANYITFTLGTQNPLLLRFPQQRFISYHCAWQFKSVECAYDGGDTECSRTYDACLLKINTDTKNNTKRFGGFIGLGQGHIRVVT